MTAFFNTGLTQQQFLDEYWQKKPLLIRQAFADFKTPISPDDLAGLACEPEIESRLIEEKGELGSWQVTNGPLTEEDFERLPPTHWTMLVQDVDKHLPELQTIIDPFRFIPDWRRDDVMISYAPKYGSVGAHTDGYDVFLLQAMGTRQWQISDQPIKEPKLISGIDVQIMETFNPDQTWRLLPGDILYLPPHFAHHGVALDDCMTFSVGFRSPSKIDMLDALVNSMLEQELGKDRFCDGDIRVANHQHEISAHAIVEMKRLLHKTIDDADALIATVLGQFVTETKSSLVELAEEKISDLPKRDSLVLAFKQGRVLEKNAYYRFAWHKQSEQGGQLFFAGECYNIEIDEHLLLLSEYQQLGEKEWLDLSTSQQSVDVLCQLIADGGWFWSELE